MPETLTVAFVIGVTPSKWARVWNERMTIPLVLCAVPDSAEAPSSTALAQEWLLQHSADLALLRLPLPAAFPTSEQLNVIPLYEETAVVVAPKDHPLEALDAVTRADIDGFTVLDGDWAESVELVAANVGVAVMPQSVARVLSRRDLVARPLTDAPPTTIALVWLAERTTPLVEEFVGIVRGRTANSSRGAGSGNRRPTAKVPPRRLRRR